MGDNKIGLGTAAIGRPLYINIGNETASGSFSLDKFREDGLRIIDQAYQSGIRHFDAAPSYGMAEELLYTWLSKNNVDDVTVSTKWGYSYIANFDPNAKEHERKEHSLEMLNRQWENSKKLLPYLKIYQIHSATFETGVLDNREILERLHQIKTDYGITIGLTTRGADQVDVIHKAAAVQVNGEPLFGSLQCTFNILEQSISALKDEKQLFPKFLIIKEALANGRIIPNSHLPEFEPMYGYLQQLMEKYDVGIDAIAMRFCMDSFPQAIVLSGTNRQNHLISNLAANTFSLTDQEMQLLRSYRIAAAHYWQQRGELTWN